MWFCPSPTCTLYKNDLMAVPLAVAGFLTRQLLKEEEHLCLHRDAHTHTHPSNSSHPLSTIPPKQHVHRGLPNREKIPTMLPCPLFHCLSWHMQAEVPGLKHTFSMCVKVLPRIVIIGSQLKRKWTATEGKWEIYCGSKLHQTQFTAGGWRPCQSTSYGMEKVLV